MSRTLLLDIGDLTVDYATPNGPLRAVNNVSLQVSQGETLALVGESGSGKSTIAAAIVDLLRNEPASITGRMLFNGRDIATASAQERRALNGNRAGDVEIRYAAPWADAQIVFLLCDEIFTLGQPILLTVEPRSLAILKIELVENREAETWKQHWDALVEAGLIEQQTVVSDQGPGLLKGCTLMGLTHHPDLFHLLRPLAMFGERFYRKALAAIAREYERGSVKVGRAEDVITKRSAAYEAAKAEAEDSVFKFFQVDITGIVRMTSYARYFKEGVGSSRPNWRWIMCFLERPKAKHLVQRLRETLELLLRIVGQYEVVDDIDQALHLHVCP